jgi:nucleoside-diphosphate-sugar epimerase
MVVRHVCIWVSRSVLKLNFKPIPKSLDADPDAGRANIKHSLADITLAEKYLGYKPAVDFEEGLKRTVAWYRERSVASSMNA